MIRKTLPTLIGSLFAAGPAVVCAQNFNVNVYGTAAVQVEGVQATGATNPAQDKPARVRATNVSSELGFKASVALGQGLTGHFQYLTGVSVESGSGMLGSAKDVFVGLSMVNVGTLKLGRLTGAARWNGGMADFSPRGAGPQDIQAALTLVSGQTGAAPQFGARIENAIGFESAKWNGFAVRGFVGANEGKSGETVASGARLDDTIYSLGLQYAQGPIDARVSYELRNDKGTLNNSTTNDTQEKDIRIGLRYTFPTNTSIGIGLDRMSFTDATATGTAKRSLNRNGWVISAKQVMGQHAVYGGYGKAHNVVCTLANGAACDGADTGANQVVLAYNYQLSKEMYLEAFATKLTNQARARYDFDNAGISPGTGADPMAFGFGVSYTF